MRNSKTELLLLDVNLPGISGLEFLAELQSDYQSNQDEAPLVIVITAHGSERLAVQAVKGGAYDYLSKPFELDDLRLVVKNAFETIQLRRENRSLRRRIEIETSQRGALLGNSAAMQNVRAMIEKVADTGATARRQGKFEQANGGTLFLDEIGDMSANVQAKLLRALEDRRIERLGGNDSIPVDVRIISATHRVLEEEIEHGNF